MAPEPILVPCEGAACPPCATLPGAVGMCSMCGAWRPLALDGTIPSHQRQDLIAMIHRGDFDPR